MLDNQLVGHNYMVKQLPGDQAAVEATAKDILNSIAERDIYTGDGIELVVCDKTGFHFKRFPLRRD